MSNVAWHTSWAVVCQVELLIWEAVEAGRRQEEGWCSKYYRRQAAADGQKGQAPASKIAEVETVEGESFAAKLALI